MKKAKLISFMAFFLCLATSCSNDGSSEKSIGSESTPAPIEEVALTFIQHTFVENYTNKETNLNEYIFRNDTIKVTEKRYEKGYYLTEKEIDKFQSNEINFEVPESVRYSFYHFTYFATEFNEETGVAKNALEPLHLNENLTIHFAIY